MIDSWADLFPMKPTYMAPNLKNSEWAPFLHARKSFLWESSWVTLRIVSRAIFIISYCFGAAMEFYSKTTSSL